jgi:hypothetical protein
MVKTQMTNNTDASTLQINLLDNCCHSLQRGYELWDQGLARDDGWLLKEAVFWIHHGIELALKQLLVQNNEFLVFSDVDSAVGKLAKLRKKSANKTVLDLFDEEDAPLSVSFNKLLPRCAMMLNLSELGEDQPLQKSIKELTRYRNKIVHFSVQLETGKVVRLLAEILKPLVHLLEDKISGSFKTECLPTIKQHIQATEVLNQIFHLPREHDNYFIGREHILEQLHEKITHSSKVFLCAAAGVGKTETAIQYAYRYRSQHLKAVLWVEADNERDFFDNFAKLAEKLKLPEKNATNIEKQKAAVRSWMGENQDWLLIVNNLDDIAMLGTVQSFIPDQQGRVLYTTRLQQELPETEQIELPALNEEEMARYILQRSLTAKFSLSEAQEHANWSTACEIIEMLPEELKRLDRLGEDVTGINLENYLQEMKESL